MSQFFRSEKWHHVSENIPGNFIENPVSGTAGFFYGNFWSLSLQLFQVDFLEISQNFPLVSASKIQRNFREIRVDVRWKFREISREIPPKTKREEEWMNAEWWHLSTVPFPRNISTWTQIFFSELQLEISSWKSPKSKKRISLQFPWSFFPPKTIIHLWKVTAWIFMENSKIFRRIFDEISVPGDPFLEFASRVVSPSDSSLQLEFSNWKYPEKIHGNLPGWCSQNSHPIRITNVQIWNTNDLIWESERSRNRAVVPSSSQLQVEFSSWDSKLPSWKAQISLVGFPTSLHPPNTIIWFLNLLRISPKYLRNIWCSIFTCRRLQNVQTSLVSPFLQWSWSRFWYLVLNDDIEVPILYRRMSFWISKRFPRPP